MMIKDTYTKTHCGTKQSDRYPKALADDFFRIDERSLEDYVAQVAEFAKQMTHYDIIGGKSTWEYFFKVDTDELKRQMEDGSVDAHYALLLSFLKLYGKQQDQLNTILKRHRDFYYKEMLGFVPKEGSIGTVPVFFELAKNATNIFVPAGTRFVAGKDSDGKSIFYKSLDDVSLNRAKVVGCKKNTANTITSISIGRATTGISSVMSSVCHEVYIPIEGLDKLDGEIIINLDNNISSANKFEYTTEEGWRVLRTLDNTLTIESGNLHFANYSKKIHKGDWKLNIPIIRVTCTNNKQLNYIIKWAKSFTASVSDSQVVEIVNKYGVVENKKGAMPFGPLCAVNDTFTLKFPFEPTKERELSSNIKLSSGGLEVKKEDSNWKKISDFTYKTVNDIYDQSKYALDLAEHLVELFSDPKSPKPTHCSALELESPMTFSYSFNLKSDKVFVVTPSLGEEPISNISKFLSIYWPYSSELYIELDGFVRKDTLSLYFNLDPYTKITSMVHRWQYYNGNNWCILNDSCIVKDTTSKLTQSGIVVLDIPRDNVKWIKASFINKYPYDAIVDVKAQVVELEYDIASEGKQNNGIALPPNTISKLENSIQGIKSVSQLYAGKAGQLDETESQFECRVSETLRHKGRAWSAWDYERLLLEHFPNIASVQCYPAYDDKWQMAAGSVLLAVIPQKNGASDNESLEPVVEETLLNEIKMYLGKRCSGHVKLYVTNPIYDKIHVKCSISLMQGYTDKEHYTNLIVRQLKAFLSPWINVEQNVAFGNRIINESDIVALISQIPFVDKLWDIQVTINDRFVIHGTDISPESIGHLLTSDINHEITIRSND